MDRYVGHASLCSAPLAEWVIDVAVYVPTRSGELMAYGSSLIHDSVTDGR